MTAPAKPTIDEQIAVIEGREYRSVSEWQIANAILSTLRAHKAIMEAERPEPVAWLVQYRDRHEFTFKKPAFLIDAIAEPLYGPDLLAYADRMRAERDAFEKKYHGLLTRLNPDIEYVEHVAVGYGADEIDRLRSQLAELQAKHDALVKDAERLVDIGERANDLFTALLEFHNAFCNRNETTSLHIWNERMKEADNAAVLVLNREPKPSEQEN